MNLPELRGNPKASKGQNFIRSRAFNYKQIFQSSHNYSDEEEKVDTPEPEEASAPFIQHESSDNLEG